MSEQAKAIADLFRRMADRIEHNKDEAFGGAAVIVPPPGNADFVGTLVLLKFDPRPDAALFWGEVKSRADEAVSELQQQMRQNTTFRR